MRDPGGIPHHPYRGMCVSIKKRAYCLGGIHHTVHQYTMYRMYRTHGHYVTTVPQRLLTVCLIRYRKK